MNTMRSTRAKRALLGCAAGVVPAVLSAACGSEPHPPSVVSRSPIAAAAPDAAEPPQAPPQYVLGDPVTRAPSGALFAMPLTRPLATQAQGASANAGPTGVILDGLRIITEGASMRAAKEIADQPLVSAHRVPARMGGGFLFRSKTAIYVSKTWDGALEPIVTTPSDIADVAFGPKAILVRGEQGERWAIELPSGARTMASPAGLYDIAALDDGRAAAIVEMGRALVSTDAGATWKDVTALLRTRPERLFTDSESLYIVEQSGVASRIDRSGSLTAFDKAPTTDRVEGPLRPKDPRWRSDEAPLRRAVRLGAPLDDDTALVVADGDVVRVNVVSGAIVSVTPGRLPPDATCEATRTSDDVVLVCTRPGGIAFVASHTLGDKVPVIEQTFATQGQFYVSDDGGIAFGGPCTRAKPSKSIVCVRSAQGGWQEFDLENATSDGGMPIEVVRWVPRADGGAIGISGGTSFGFVDARTGELRPWPVDAATGALRSSLAPAVSYKRPSEAVRIADRAWSVTSAGTLRGWGSGNNAGAFEVTLDGNVTPSAFSFDRVATAGPFALARTKDGRVWQTLDRGLSWSEVLAPLMPRPQSLAEVRACSAVGCDLGAWYRLGWMATAPAPPLPPTTAPPAPQLSRTPLPKLVCKPIAEVKKSSLPRTERSPDDFALGLNRVAVSDEKGESEYVRTAFARALPSPTRDTDAPSDENASRALAHGHSTTTNDADKLVVQGPVKDLSALRRSVYFVAPFDPAGAVRKNSIAVSDVVAAFRVSSGVSGASASEFLKQDPITLASVVPITASDPATPNDLLFTCDNGILGALRASGAPRMRLTLVPKRTDETKLVSAIAMGPDDLALLEEDATGKARVVRVTQTGALSAFELPPPPSTASYPVNVDALAVGPKGELGVIRMPSAAEPASAMDPALLLDPSAHGSGGAQVSALAPWSALISADDPACKSDASGWRATIQTVAAWIKLSGTDTNAQDDAPMVARVRWSASRVCLEAVELRAEDIQMSTSGSASALPALGFGHRRFGGASLAWEGPVENWVVVRFGTGGSAARVGIMPGVEIHQALTCALAP
jgi:hypothetical protein